MKHHFTLYSNY